MSSEVDFDNSWVFDAQDKIYSRIDALCTAKLSSKYPNINVTTDSHKVVNAKFPNVYMRFWAKEVGKDLENKTINAVYLTVNIDVTVTAAQKMEVAREVSGVVLDGMKGMSFDGDEFSVFNDTDTEYRMVSTFARYIGNADELF